MSSVSAKCDALVQACVDEFGKIDVMSVQESELWFWRYHAESLHQTGAELANYELVIYEKLARDPISVMRQLYSRCKLLWSARVESAIRITSHGSEERARVWHHQLDPEHHELVGRVLRACTLRHCWDDANEYTVVSESSEVAS